MEYKYRYRNKGNKIQVQKLENSKWISRTLPAPEEVFLWLCPDNVSLPTQEPTQPKEQKEAKKFAQLLLDEPLEKDTNEEKGLETDEELKAKAKEALRKLDIWKK